MSVILSPAQKAWATRRANGSVKPAAVPATTERGDTRIVSVMVLGISEVESLPCVTGSFRFIGVDGKAPDEDLLTPVDKALLSVRLVSIADEAKPGSKMGGHEYMTAYLSDATVSDLESILQVMRSLDSVLSEAREQSEDSSLAMAMQAISWHLRIQVIEYDGKGSKRGAIYPLVENLTENMLALYAANAG